MTTFGESRDFLLAKRTDYVTAYREFRWPDPVPFNWAIDWFDGHLAREPGTRDSAALWVVDAAGATETRISFGEMSARSSQVANFLRDLGLSRGDRLLLLLGNTQPLWEVLLAAIKLGVVIIPATTLLSGDELRDRVERGRVKAIVTSSDQADKIDRLDPAGVSRVVVGAGTLGSPWVRYEDCDFCSDIFRPEGPTQPDDPMLLYFTSGTTAKPKLVLHSQRSYPVGHLSTMYWLGLQPGDIHLNISSPGWAKHAWSCVFAPWNAGATVFVVNQPRFDAKSMLTVIERYGVTTLCAPPTVWRLLVQEDLSACKTALREVCGAGEPLNPEIIERVRKAWGLTIRDGYGQTETTAQIGNPPGQELKLGSMGRPLPGYHVALLDPDGKPTREGEVSLWLDDERPAGLMQGYEGFEGRCTSPGETAYRTGDVAWIDDEGYLTFVGRADDVFKSSDYRISPFELESVLIEHEAIAEVAVVPTPDPIRLSLPKAYVVLVKSADPSPQTALSIFRAMRGKLASFRRVRRLEFVEELPKTISGKIRRVQLRRLEQEDRRDDPFRGIEYREEDFPELENAGR